MINEDDFINCDSKFESFQSNGYSHTILFFQLEFVGIRGSGVRSDIAIDAITAYDGDCEGI